MHEKTDWDRGKVIKRTDAVDDIPSALALDNDREAKIGPLAPT